MALRTPQRTLPSVANTPKIEPNTLAASTVLHDDDEEEEEEGIKQVFINARKIDEEGEPWAYEEGCLSIPFIRADVTRPEQLTIEYYDENWEKQIKTLEGLSARVVQHEYDHIEGILFTDHLKPLKKKLLKRKLEAIKKGNIDADYRMRFKSQKR